MKWRGLGASAAIAGLLAACAMPQPPGMPIPSGPSMPGGSSSPTSMPSPAGSPSPSGSSGSQSPAGSSSPSGSSGSAGMPGSPMPSGSSGEGDASTAGSPGSSSGDSGTESAGGAEPIGGASVPWPEQPGGVGDVGDLDEQLDESLGDFDETVLAGGGAPVEEEIDILDPVGQGSGGTPGGNQPIFEEGDLDEEGAAGDGTYENVDVAQRAEAGGGGGASGGSAGSGSAAGGAASGGGGGAAATSGTARGGSGSSGAEDGAVSVDDIPIPEDVGDGRNDDIVLRQIRDAASKEADPVLREKLWDEYRRIRDQK